MNMMEMIWKIRDARGLDAYEKNFLFTVASRGEAGMFCEWKRNVADMGMKKDAYYNRRTTLLNKGLITAQMQNEGPTIYKIDESGLDDWLLAHSVSQNDSATQNTHSVTQNGHSATQNEHSVRPERKKNTKINNKKNTKKNTPAEGAVPAPVQDKIETDKEEQSVDSLIGDNPEDSLIFEESPVSPLIEENNPEEGAGEAPVESEGITEAPEQVSEFTTHTYVDRETLQIKKIVQARTEVPWWEDPRYEVTGDEPKKVDLFEDMTW